MRSTTRRLPGGTLLWDEVHGSSSLGEIEFTMGALAGRKARAVRQALARPARDARSR